MPATTLQKTVAKAIKDYLIGLGIARSDVSVTSSGGLSSYVQARIRPIKDSNFMAPQRYLVTIPLDDRIEMLKIIYPNSPSCWNGSAGNIHHHMCTMHAEQWVKFLELKGVNLSDTN